jgi:hypothetical protein
MTDDLVNRIVEQLRQLHVAIRLKAPPEVCSPKPLGPWIRTCVCENRIAARLTWAGVTVAEKTEASEEPQVVTKSVGPKARALPLTCVCASSPWFCQTY